MAKKKSVKKSEGKINFNKMAIAGFVLAFLSWFAILGIVLSIVALLEIKKSNHRGRRLAIGGIIIGSLVIIGTATGYLSF
tara:strand:+ start:49 stop:288 length:240 start_codon:yes stop_codon:yes gene_type:complete